MSLILSRKISNKRMNILKFVFTVRGALCEQIVKGLNYEVNNSSVKTMYTSLRKLQEDQLITYLYVPKVNKRLYYLTEEGYEFMLRIHQIKPGHIGKGFNNDHGVFRYDRYKPPAKQLTHFLLQVDLQIEMMDLKQNNSTTLVFDYRDNRYSTKRFKLENTTNEHTFRPDGELLTIRSKKLEGRSEEQTTTNIYSVEIDTGSERHSKLFQKFELYRNYFDYLIESQQPLPNSIVFASPITDKQYGYEQRWVTISHAFLEAIGPYSSKVNLAYDSVDGVQNFLKREVAIPEYINMLNEVIKGVFQQNSMLSGLPLKVFRSSETGCSNNQLATVVNLDRQHKALICYVRIDGYETKGWVQLREFLEFIEKQKGLEHPDYLSYSKVIPVMYYSHNKGVPLHPTYYKNTSLLSSGYYLNLMTKQWSTVKGISLEGTPFDKLMGVTK